MKNSSLINRVVVLLMFFTKFQLFANDLPSEFDQIINDNPTDAPIHLLFWQILLIGIALGFVLFHYKKRSQLKSKQK
jgi:divalent metal cation (Fe/Co/Zn/Cd) transporter